MPSSVLDTSQVLELRQYTLHPGARDTLIELFDRAFVETQEAVGMRVLGQFCDLDAPDRFVWLRGFADLASRAARLEAFYSGPIWGANREAANATMIDSDNVLLLRPVDASAGFLLPATRAARGPTRLATAKARTSATRAATQAAGATAAADATQAADATAAADTAQAAFATGAEDATQAADATAAADATQAADATAANGALVTATIYLLRAPADDAFVRFFNARVGPILAMTGAPPLARFRTEYGKNEFPRLPVREGEHAFVWFASFASAADHERHRTALARAMAEHPAVAAELERLCASPPQQLRLAPTTRSLLRHAEPEGYTLHRRGDVHDFDFIAGEWNIANRKLAARGVGSTEWDEFPSTHRAALYLGGIANVEEIACPARGWSGMAMRHFRLAERQWSIHWVSSATGAIDPPVLGGFHGDRGEFYGEDRDGARPVKVRFIWTRLGPTTARWEQAFSYDDGPWETNWVMDFTRAAR